MFSCELELTPIGTPNSGFRTLDSYDGQVERHGVFNTPYGTSLSMQMDLVDVIHGTMVSDGDPATLIIADFQFLNRGDTSRRFQNVVIAFRFREYGSFDDNPPEVKAIAPKGKFAMNPTEKIRQLTRGANVTVSGGSVANASAGLEWSLTDEMTIRSHAEMTGRITLVDRVREPHNVAEWSLKENEDRKTGIPSFLRVAILLRRKDKAKFKASFIVDAKIGRFRKLHQQTRTEEEARRGEGDIDPVTFDPEHPRPSSNPIPPYIDPSNLQYVKLEELVSVQSEVKILPSLDIQPNMIAREPNLTFENVMGSLQQKDNFGQTPITKEASSRSPQNTNVSTNQGAKHTSQKLVSSVHDSLPTSLEQSISDGLDLLGVASREKANTSINRGTSIEETMRLLLHAVRKGVEVIAEANRIKLEAWPERIEQGDEPDQNGFKTEEGK